MKNSNHELIGQLELASPTGRGQAIEALRRGRRPPPRARFHPRTYHARLVSQIQGSGQMRSPGSDAPRLCASPEAMALASWGIQPLLASSVFPWGPQSRGCRSGREVHFWSKHPFLPEAPAFLGWVGKAPKPPAGAGYTHHQIRHLPGMMPLLGAVIASSG